MTIVLNRAGVSLIVLSAELMRLRVCEERVCQAAFESDVDGLLAGAVAAEEADADLVVVLLAGFFLTTPKSADELAFLFFLELGATAAAVLPAMAICCPCCPADCHRCRYSCISFALSSA